MLLVTVDDSNHLLTYEQVDSLVQRLQPRIVIPMHYAIPGLHSTDCELLPADEWLRHHHTVHRLETDRFDFTLSKLPTQTEIWLFQPASASLTAPEIRP